MIDWLPTLYFLAGVISLSLYQSIRVLMNQRHLDTKEDGKKAWEKIETLNFTTSAPATWSETKKASYFLQLIAEILQQHSKNPPDFSVQPGVYDLDIRVNMNFIQRSVLTEASKEEAGKDMD